jgi:DNA-binding MarR family transcriptional regulator
MVTSSDLPAGRLAVGQLLGQLLRQFRSELLSPAADAGFDDLREAHLQIFGNVGIHGIRLTHLAAKAQLSPAATSELVDDLQALGYLERHPDPSDGRAKLIYPTRRGRRALDAAGDRVAEIEQRWARIVGRPAFDAAMQTLQELVRASDSD